MKMGTAHIILRKKIEISYPSVAVLGLLIYFTANGCTPSSRRPSVPPVTTTANVTAPVDVNSPVPYFHLDSGRVLEGINGVLRRSEFTRATLNDGFRVWTILDGICWVLDGEINPDRQPKDQRATYVCTSFWQMHPADWLLTKDVNEANKAVVAKLIRDPEFVFDGGEWTTVLNVFNSDGRLDQYTLGGNIQPDTNLLQVKRVDVAHLKPPGTFRWAPRPS